MNETAKNSSSHENLLDFIVDCIAKFIKDRNIRRQLPIGFTFPFPVNHESLTCGKLIRWTKDFEGAGSGARGKDVVELLKEAVSKRGVSVQQTTATSLRMSLLHAIGCDSQCGCIDQRYNWDSTFCGEQGARLPYWASLR